MWYPQILTMMGIYGKVVPETEVTMCASIGYDEDTLDNFDNRFITRALVVSILSNFRLRGLFQWVSIQVNFNRQNISNLWHFQPYLLIM